MVLRTDEMQLSRGESIRDTAYVLSRHAAAIGIRTGPDDEVAELARHASVPVINMLTAGHHPCQALADLLTLREAFGSVRGLTLAYVGDGNNVARSLAIVGASRASTCASPRRRAISWSRCPAVILTDDPVEAVDGADAVYTDVWVSMSDDPASAEARRRALAPYRIDAGLLIAPPPCHRAALPARPSRRRDHRRCAVRRPSTHLGSGREPAPRAEGAAGAARRLKPHTPLHSRARCAPVGVGSRHAPSQSGAPHHATRKTLVVKQFRLRHHQGRRPGEHVRPLAVTARSARRRRRGPVPSRPRRAHARQPDAQPRRRSPAPRERATPRSPAPAETARSARSHARGRGDTDCQDRRLRRRRHRQVGALRREGNRLRRHRRRPATRSQRRSQRRRAPGGPRLGQHRGRRRAARPRHHPIRVTSSC